MTITNNNDWIEWKWTPEKPYPETLETKVFTKHVGGFIFDEEGEQETVAWWHDDVLELSNWYDHITHYRLA